VADIVFDNVSKVFDRDVLAVDSLTLEIPDQEFMVLLGPSGCGKSTALRMIAGLESITTGTVSIGGDVVNDVDARDRDIAMVFQSYALYPHMTVRKNIESPLRASKLVDRDERNELVDEAARILGLEDLLNRKPGQLSGGQRQRVALGRAIVRRPRAFLMDEPLSNLDAKLRGQTRVELVDLYRRLETTFVYVTHDQIEAMTMATRIAILNEGALQQTGTPRDVYRSPANLFVARFIGSPPMNTIDATFSGGALVLADDERIPITPSQPVSEGQQVVAGVRPEHIHIVGETTAHAQVIASEWLGHEKHVAIQLGGQDVIAREPGEGTIVVGDTVPVLVQPDEVHLFDPDSGLRLA
jgi:ABC-type sugar transport system ATPase subunit